MLAKRFLPFFVIALIVFSCCSLTLAAPPIEIVSGSGQRSEASIEAAAVDGKQGVKVIFKGTDDLHFYADPETALVADFVFKVTASADGVTFGEAIYPEPKDFYDAGQEKDVDVYIGNFEIFVPITSGGGVKDVKVTVTGQGCTSEVCFAPFKVDVTGNIDLGEVIAQPTVIDEPTTDKASTEEATAVEGSKGLGTAIMLLLALVGGLSFNIMPCVLPVIPIIMMRLIDQSKESSSKRIALGMSFCGGIILFFTAFAIIAAIINVATGSVISMNDYLRYPSLAAGMFLVVLVFGLFMFDVFQVGIPSSVASKSGSGSGALGSIGMGFFASVLSIPCTGAILAFVMVWAQTKTATVSVLAFMLMGVGMALPYALLVIFPTLLNKVPKPGTWVENFRKAMGFLLIFIAVKLMLPALSQTQMVAVLKYAVVLSFAVWIWGCWVSFSTPRAKKFNVRMIAVAIAVAGWFIFMPAMDSTADQTIAGSVKHAGDLVDWQSYDQAAIDKAVEAKTPVLIKFTADWCTNCKVVNKKVFKDQSIADMIAAKGILAIKGDTTRIGMPAEVALKEVFGIPGTVPVTILLLPDGSKEELTGIYKKEALAATLQTLPDTK